MLLNTRDIRVWRYVSLCTLIVHIRFKLMLLKLRIEYRLRALSFDKADRIVEDLLQMEQIVVATRLLLLVWGILVVRVRWVSHVALSYLVLLVVIY